MEENNGLHLLENVEYLSNNINADEILYVLHSRKVISKEETQFVRETMEHQGMTIASNKLIMLLANKGILMFLPLLTKSARGTATVRVCMYVLYICMCVFT